MEKSIECFGCIRSHTHFRCSFYVCGSIKFPKCRLQNAHQAHTRTHSLPVKSVMKEFEAYITWAYNKDHVSLAWQIDIHSSDSGPLLCVFLNFATHIQRCTLLNLCDSQTVTHFMPMEATKCNRYVRSKLYTHTNENEWKKPANFQRKIW